MRSRLSRWVFLRLRTPGSDMIMNSTLVTYESFVHRSIPWWFPLSLMLPRRSGARRIFLWQLLHFRPLNVYVWALGSDVTAQPTVMANRDKLLSGLSPMWRNIFCLGMFFNIFFFLRSILLIPSS
jgi:hypothetical protein